MATERRTTLEDITIADFSHALAAPYGVTLLADMGANVIKVEELSGDPMRHTAGGTWNIMTNRNKRNISLDLKNNKAKEVGKRILSKADVVVESFTPGAIDRLGFGYEAVREFNPKIIYCSVSGFGQTGPYRNLRGFDVVAQAASGLMLNTGDADRPPVRVGTSAVDLGTGAFLALAIVLALIDREKTGKGQKIDISLFETALSWMSQYALGYVLTGQLPQRLGSGFAAFCPYKVYEASDGYVFIGCALDAMFKSFRDIFDLTELKDPEYDKNAARLKDREKIDDIVQKAMSNYTVKDIVDRLIKVGVPCSPVNSVKDTLEDPHAEARGIYASMTHPQAGAIRFTHTPIMRDNKFAEIYSHSPALGEHTRDILTELGYSDSEIEELLSSGAAVAAKK